MKSKGVVGKRIVGIQHVRWFDQRTKKMLCAVDSLTLEDGTVLYPHAIATDVEPYGDLLVRRYKKSSEK